MIKMDFKGGREIEAALMQLKTAGAKSVARRVLKRHGQTFADAANAAAPEGDGNLSSSYEVGTQLTRRQRRAAGRKDAETVAVHVGTSDPAGVQQEFGNSRHAAQPHARPAWMQTRDEMLEGITDDMLVEVEKSVARARKRNA